MTAQRESVSRVNPFSTRFVRPGAVPFLFGRGESVAVLVERFQELGWRGQIVGPHGSGKSTLLVTLVDALARAERPVCVFTLHDRQRRLARGWVAQARDAAAQTIVIDGYEQLSWVGRLSVRMACRRNGWGLLVTAHRSVGLPTLLRVTPNLEVARRVVEHLAAAEDGPVSDDEIAECFDANGGNVREMLFTLYDRFEQRRRQRTSVA